ncbi:hypothetical protein OAR42_04530 [Planktomarina temperata]|nr:hypothetical protein [Planktomarina temperata]MDC6462626.1 hypothetical protein [Planktomarina temperata]
MKQTEMKQRFFFLLLMAIIGTSASAVTIICSEEKFQIYSAVDGTPFFGGASEADDHILKMTNEKIDFFNNYYCNTLVDADHQLYGWTQQVSDDEITLTCDSNTDRSAYKFIGQYKINRNTGKFRYTKHGVSRYIKYPYLQEERVGSCEVSVKKF